MRAAAALLPFIALIAPAAAWADTLTIALSTDEISINSNFTGTDLTVFGVIAPEKGAPPASNQSRRVAVMLLGPRETVVTRRKDRVLGIWANRDATTIIGPPSFYAVDTSVPVAGLAAPEVLQRLQIGFDNIAFVYQGHATVNDPAAADFRDAFIRLKQQAGLFQQTWQVGFVGDAVFRSRIHLPASIPVGTYTAIAYLFSGGDLVAHADGRVEVMKTGFEATMSQFASNQSLVYGLMCALLAIFIGWLGGAIFRRD